MTPARSRTAPHPDQLEFTFAPQVSFDTRVDRLPDGRVLLTPSTEVKVWGTTADAAEALGKSRRWVQDALDAGVLRGEKVGKCWRVDMVHLHEIRRKARNW